MASDAGVRLAILDDYQAIAAPKFQRLASRLEISSFPDTLNQNDSRQKQRLIERLKPFTVICTMRERTAFPADVLSELLNLRLLQTTGPKNAAIDLKACSERDIIVAGTKGRPPTSLDSTMNHTWALILGLARNIARDDAVIKSGGWQTSLATGLKGKTLGILGLGQLGADAARVGHMAFGMKVLAWSSSLTQEAADEKARGFGLPNGAFKVAQSKDEMCKESDVLSVHYVLSARSKGIVGSHELGLMKPTALLVNTSRGPLIDESALLATLKAGRIRGAGLDVHSTEPLPEKDEWRTTPWGKDGRSEVILSPHMGYAEEGVMHVWYDQIVDNVERWLDGKDVEMRLK